MPGSPIQFTARAKYAKKKNTRGAPRKAPMSGRRKSRVRKPTRTRRSSAGLADCGLSMESPVREWATGRPPTTRGS
jgi:hypothetical protein